jgi:hypothetical protein
MTRLTHAWRAMHADQRLAALAAVGLLLTMFFPWYGLQSLNRKTGVIYSHSISAFGDVSFVEAAIFLVAAGVAVMLIARAEGREFNLPGGDGTVVMVAGAWAALLIFFRVFSRPSGDGYPVGIEWGFFLAFVAAGALAYAGWRMRAGERPPPVSRPGSPRRRAPRPQPSPGAVPSQPPAGPVPARSGSSAALAARPSRRPYPASPTAEEDPDPDAAPRAGERGRYPPAPPEQLSFEDPPTKPE